jgi:hypothetical protein
MRAITAAPLNFWDGIGGGPVAGRSSASPIVPTRGDNNRLGHTRPVGLNPFRVQRRRPSDYVLVGVALAVTLVLVLWALF